MEILKRENRMEIEPLQLQKSQSEIRQGYFLELNQYSHYLIYLDKDKGRKSCKIKKQIQRIKNKKKIIGYGDLS